MNTKQLQQKILDLAIRGKLVAQDASDESASELLKRIEEEKAQLVKEAKLKKTALRSFEKPVPVGEFLLPESWLWVNLGYISDMVLGKMLDVQKNVGDLKPYLRNLNVRWNCFNLDDLLEMKFQDCESDRYSVRRGDLVVCEGGEPGRCAVWNFEETIFIQKALHRVRPFGGIDPQFICYLLWFYAETGVLEKSFTGSTIKHLTGQSLSSLVIPLPPVNEQHRIVAAIEAAFAVIDEIEAAKKELKTKVETAKAKILDLAIRGKLVAQDQSEKLSGQTTNGLLAGWKQERLGWRSGGTPNRSNPSYYGGNIPWLKTGDLTDGEIFNIPESITETALQESAAKLNPTGSVLIAMYGATIGKLGILKFPAATNHACCACSDFKNIDQMFLFYFLLQQRKKFIAQAEGGAQPNISKDKIVKTIIPLPPLTEQHRIVAAIEAAFAELDAIAAEL